MKNGSKLINFLTVYFLERSLVNQLLHYTRIKPNEMTIHLARTTFQGVCCFVIQPYPQFYGIEQACSSTTLFLEQRGELGAKP